MSSRKSALLKTVTWRMLATVDTFVLSYLITGSLKWASSVGVGELFTKMLLYYLHERAWSTEWRPARRAADRIG
jgi:uncharacterized membrane protein